MAVFDGNSFFPVPMALLAERVDSDNTSVAFHSRSEKDVLAAFKLARPVSTLRVNEFKVYWVISARCHNRTKPDIHSAWITNAFIQEFSGLRQSEVDSAIDGLVELKLVRVHKPSPKAQKRRYWLTSLDGEPYSGQPVLTGDNKPQHVKERYKGPRKSKAEEVERGYKAGQSADDGDTWGQIA